MKKYVIVFCILSMFIIGGCGKKDTYESSEEYTKPSESIGEHKPWVSPSSPTNESQTKETEASSSESQTEESTESSSAESDIIELDWYKDNFLDLGMDSNSYITIDKDSLVTDNLEDKLPEWAYADIIFYPDDSEILLKCFAVAIDVYGDNISFEESESKSYFAYKNDYVYVYKVDGVDVCFVFSDNLIYCYKLSNENNLR